MKNSYTFSNNVTIVNSTPHPIRFQDITGEIITIDSDPQYIINARVEEDILEEYGMCPVPGHERVAPADKLMRVDKFTRY